MSVIDLIIVAVYVVAMLIWGLYVGLRETSEDFLVFAREAPLVLVLFSLISTWVGSGTTVATAASGYSTGLSLGLTAAVGGLVGVVFAALFAPRIKDFGDRYEAHTLADFFHERYTSSSRLVGALFITLVYLLITAAQFVALAALLEVWTGIGFTVIIWAAAGTTILYTAVAGIKSDFYTDVAHFTIMLVVLAVILLPNVLGDIGGIAGLTELPSGYFDPFAYGGVSFFVAGIVFGAASVFVTMEIWQRIYASTTKTVAQRALLIGLIGIVLFYAISTVLGMSAQVIDPGIADRDHALFVLMTRYLSEGMLGIGVAGFVAVFVSTINSTLMVAAATLTKDVYKGFVSPDVGDQRLLIVGRILTLGYGVAALGVALTFRDVVLLSVNGLLMLLILFPAVIGGFFWRGATSKAAVWSIVCGILAMLAFWPVNPDMAFAPGFLISGVVFVGVSTMTKHHLKEDLRIVGSFWRGHRGKQ